MFAAILAIIFGLVGLIVIDALIRGFVLSYLWLWFVVPLGVSEIGIAHAIGLATVVGMLTTNTSSSSDDSKDTSGIIGTVIGHLLGPFLVLLIGYIVHSFM